VPRSGQDGNVEHGCSPSHVVSPDLSKRRQAAGCRSALRLKEHSSANTSHRNGKISEWIRSQLFRDRDRKDAVTNASLIVTNASLKASPSSIEISIGTMQVEDGANEWHPAAMPLLVTIDASGMIAHPPKRSDPVPLLAAMQPSEGKFVGHRHGKRLSCRPSDGGNPFDDPGSD
jgi:hypothetical protein